MPTSNKEPELYADKNKQLFQAVPAQVKRFMFWQIFGHTALKFLELANTLQSVLEKRCAAVTNLVEYKSQTVQYNDIK